MCSTETSVYTTRRHTDRGTNYSRHDTRTTLLPYQAPAFDAINHCFDLTLRHLGRFPKRTPYVWLKRLVDVAPDGSQSSDAATRGGLSDVLTWNLTIRRLSNLAAMSKDVAS